MEKSDQLEQQVEQEMKPPSLQEDAEETCLHSSFRRDATGRLQVRENGKLKLSLFCEYCGYSDKADKGRWSRHWSKNDHPYGCGYLSYDDPYPAAPMWANWQEYLKDPHNVRRQKVGKKR